MRTSPDSSRRKIKLITRNLEFSNFVPSSVTIYLRVRLFHCTLIRQINYVTAIHTGHYGRLHGAVNRKHSAQPTMIHQYVAT